MLYIKRAAQGDALLSINRFDFALNRCCLSHVEKEIAYFNATHLYLLELLLVIKINALGDRAEVRGGDSAVQVFDMSHEISE